MMNLLNSPKTSHTFLNNLSMNLKCAWGDMRRGGRKRGEKKKSHVNLVLILLKQTVSYHMLNRLRLVIRLVIVSV